MDGGTSFILERGMQGLSTGKPFEKLGMRCSPTGEIFLKDVEAGQDRILGLRCNGCGTVYVPPPSVCGPCFKRPDEWVELSTKGMLCTYTVANYSLPIHPVATPLILGLVQLDGADTRLLHLLGEVDHHEPRAGIWGEAVFSEERQGNILDIRYFRPVREA